MTCTQVLQVSDDCLPKISSQLPTASFVACRRESLTFAEQYLAGFGVPRALVTGNHDLEGDDFDTDEANLEAWRQVLFGGQHCSWPMRDQG